MTAELSCLGCGLIREPSTWDLTSHAYLCVECVGAIRVRHDPALVAQLLSDHFASCLMPSTGRWDQPLLYAHEEVGATVKTPVDQYAISWSDSMRGRVEEFCKRLLVNVVGPTNRPDRTADEIATDLATQLRDYANRLEQVRWLATSTEEPTDE
jgi:hypothetical protein